MFKRTLTEELAQHRGQLQQVFLNLIMNAIEAMGTSRARMLRVSSNTILQSFSSRRGHASSQMDECGSVPVVVRGFARGTVIDWLVAELHFVGKSHARRVFLNISTRRTRVIAHRLSICSVRERKNGREIR
jgi:hypothetical protein